jgi:hypothetical protein
MRRYLLRGLAAVASLAFFGGAGAQENTGIRILLCLIGTAFLLYALFPLIAGAAGFGEKAGQRLSDLSYKDQTTEARPKENASVPDSKITGTLPSSGRNYSVLSAFVIAPFSCSVAGWWIAKETKDFDAIQGITGGAILGLAAAFIMLSIDRRKNRKQ